LIKSIFDNTVLSANKSRMIAVASGKGGTGKTTLAVSLFHWLEKRLQVPVGLVDCDVEEPNDLLFFPRLRLQEQTSVYQDIPEIDTSVCTFCKRCVAWCSFNAITMVAGRKFASVDPALCHSCGACLAACPENAITEKPHPLGTITRYRTERGYPITEGRLAVGSAMQTMLIKALKKQARQPNGVTILDAPPGTSCPVVETIADVDYVILVTEPTPFGLHDLKITIELVTELKIPFGVVVNKAGLGSAEVYSFLKEQNIALLGEIPYSREMARRYASGNLLDGFTERDEQLFSQIINQVL
jgi:MinD superfamily P-loop ATPase